MSDVKRVKPQNPKGTRDFLPVEVAKRNYIFDTIKSVFYKYGFEQIETPALERLETLTGKYGDEGDKLLFKILNSGDFLKDVPKDELANANSQATIKYISEKGLRYDLTVPLARYVVQNQDKLPFPFKRFHIGLVWRADRPQKGRYQEFYQCDADVIGSTSLINEVELTMIYAEVFKLLNINATIRINNRKILEALAEINDCSTKLTDITVIIDKCDKIGFEGVERELKNLALTDNQVSEILSLLQTENLESLKNPFAASPTGLKGVDETEEVIRAAKSGNVKFDITLARGLNYYTGIIWEVICNNVKIGSIASGGRYDNLTEMFGGQNMSGVGISFGIERMYDVMEELNLFPDTILKGVKVLFVPRDNSADNYCLNVVQQLRQNGVSAEIFTGNVKKQKQFAYAEAKNITYIIEIGANEMDSNQFRLRNVKEKKEEGAGFTLQNLISKLQ